ncbi:MAG: hypothetical protein ABIJ20_03680 [Nanoarchaeota archaeon]|nr:hypothetical protein [Nanoarchaeota archaeon]MBU1445544.1 hypothetical protein [Nanoarchaeota archaeon]MBU2420643.1 hypothetical protein [Nanoarchaeota archaeon]MBU2474909.1 hypothetical protein [Nanoarchaeota archaeon]
MNTKRNKKIKPFEKEIKNSLDEAIDYIKEPKHIKILKILVVLIVIGLLGFLIYNNILISKEFNYFYDIGGERDTKKPYLIPAKRVSDIIVEEGVNYRNLTGHLVYFDVLVSRGAENINIEARYKENFPEKAKFYIGARDREEWHYKNSKIYDSREYNQTGDWSIAKTGFSIEEDNISIMRGKLILAFNIPYLDQNETEYANYINNYIPIDYINLTIYKPGMIERIKRGESFLEALKGVMN